MNVKKPFYKRTWVIIVGVLIVLIVISNLSDESTTIQSANTVNTVTEQVEAKEAQWVTICNLKGNGSKKSPLFELTGGEAKIKYRYKAPDANVSIGMGAFIIYVLDEGVDLMKDGGFPEINSGAVKEDTESVLHKSAGSYYLSVDGVGSWEVTVEEKR